MKALIRPGGGDAGPSDGDQVISIFLVGSGCEFLCYM